MKIIFIYLFVYLSISSIIAQTTNFIDIKLKDTSKIKISGRTTVIGNTNNVSSVNANGYSNNYDKILLSVESGDPSIAGQSVGGFLTPRMTTTQRNTIFNGTTINGTLIYNTTTNAFEYYSTGNNSWQQIVSNSASNNLWALASNNGYNTNNGSTSSIGIGTSSPLYTLDVRGTVYVTDTIKGLGTNNQFDKFININNGDLIINNGSLINSRRSVNVNSYKFYADSIGNVANAGNINTGSINTNNTIIANNDITSTSGNIKFGGKLVNTVNNRFKFTKLSYKGDFGFALDFSTNGGVLLITFSGAGYTSTANKIIGMRCGIDNLTSSSTVYVNSNIFVNVANNHITIPSRTVYYNNIAAGNHTFIIIRDTSDSKADANDFFYVTILEFPF